MKSSKEIKKELHEYIDNIEDEETLWMVHEEVAEYLNQSKLSDDELTEEQEKSLDEAIRQADAGEFVTEEEYQKATARGRTK
jgi:predicted transcriptional regulator